MKKIDAGFREIEHTADWAMQVWAPGLPQLFKIALEGMNTLAEIKLRVDERIQRKIVLDAHDTETLLIDFLSEILYLGEKDNLGFNEIEVILGDGKLIAICSGASILSKKKEIKAVTYHNLEIIKNNDLYQVEIVFDV